MMAYTPKRMRQSEQKQIPAEILFMPEAEASALRETQPPFEVIGWLALSDHCIVIQTNNGVERLNWMFNLNLTLDRDMLRKALGFDDTMPILGVLRNCEGKLFPPQSYFKSY